METNSKREQIAKCLCDEKGILSGKRQMTWVWKCGQSCGSAFGVSSC